MWEIIEVKKLQCSEKPKLIRIFGSVSRGWIDEGGVRVRVVSTMNLCLLRSTLFKSKAFGRTTSDSRGKPYNLMYITGAPVPG